MTHRLVNRCIDHRERRGAADEEGSEREREEGEERGGSHTELDRLCPTSGLEEGFDQGEEARGRFPEWHVPGGGKYDCLGVAQDIRFHRRIR